MFEIGHREPIFFLHIPKTAGMSMRTYLSNQYHPEQVCPAVTWAEAVRKGVDFSRYRLVQGHFQYNLKAALQPGTKTLTVLRDPLLRTVSSLRHLQRDPQFHQDHALTAGQTLKQMIRNPILLARQRNVQAAALCASAAPADVLQFLRYKLETGSDADPVSLEQLPNIEVAQARLEEIDFLLTTDYLAALMQDMAEAMRFHPVNTLPLINEAPDSGTTLAGLDAEEVGLLEEVNSIDLQLYRRAKEIIEQRQFEQGMARLIEAGMYARPQGPFRIDLQGPIPGRGWYQAEGGPGKAWRWTGPSTEFTLEFPLQTCIDYTLEMVFSAVQRLGGLRIRLKANGRNISSETMPAGTGYQLRAMIPQSTLERSNGLCRLVFNVDSTIRPAGDLRSLGIAVSCITLTPVSHMAHQVPNS